MSDDLRTAVAFVFQRAGKPALTDQQVRHHVSMDLRWFDPKEARRFVEACLDRGLLEEADDGGLAPTFDVRGVDVPLGFRPRLTVGAGSGSGSASGGPSSLEAVIDRLTGGAGLSREQAVARINREQARFDGLLDPEVAGMVVAREVGVDVDDLVEAYLARAPDGSAEGASAGDEAPDREE